LIFGAIAGLSELIIFHLLADWFPQKTTVVIGEFVDEGFNWNLIKIPFYRIGIYTIAGTVLSSLGGMIRRYRK